MKYVCFTFKIHQPYRLKRYRFFDIGNDHYYYDDFADDEIMTRVAYNSYIPMCDTLLEMVKKYKGEFKCSINVSGTAIEQIQIYVPELIDKLRALAETGCVDFIATTYSHSLSSVVDPEEFIREVKAHDELIYRLLGVRSKTFANTELIYDDDIAAMVKSMGYETCLTDGAKHVLGWKSPNYVYRSVAAPDLKVVMTNDKMAEDITMNFNNPEWDEYPLTADKYVNWLANLPMEEQIVAFYMSMETFGSFIPASAGIFEFMKALPEFGREKGVQFTTLTEATSKLNPVDYISVNSPISRIDETRDLSAWRGNELQNEALNKLYAVAERVSLCDDRRLKKDYEYLQSSDHFYYMSTKNMKDGATHAFFSPYDSPFAAFTNYMNVLSDFLVRVDEQYPEDMDNEELNSLILTIRNQSAEIDSLKKENKSLRSTIEQDQPSELPEVAPIAGNEEPVVAAPEKKKTTRKACAKKTTDAAAAPKKTTRKKKTAE